MLSAKNKIQAKDRFVNTSDTEKEQILLEKNAKSTNKATKSHIRLLSEYVTFKFDKPIEAVATDEFPQILADFYSDVQTQEKELYTIQSLKCMRASFNRYFKAERGTDIIQDPHFM